MIEQSSQPTPRDSETGMRERFVEHLREENFVLYSQAILALAPSGAAPDFREIFVRYKEEEEGLLPPGSFLPILEDQGLLPFLDRWVVFRLLRWCRDAIGTSRPKPCCSLNLSIDTVRLDRGFSDYVLASLDRTGVPGDCLSFEIPAIDALVYKSSLARMIPPLRAAGCTFASSGFRGDGPTFELATSLGITYAKLDGTFSFASPGNPQMARLPGIIERCRDSSMRTIATLVEDSEALARMRALNVDFVQGFAIERPRPLYDG